MHLYLFCPHSHRNCKHLCSSDIRMKISVAARKEMYNIKNRKVERMTIWEWNFMWHAWHLPFYQTRSGCFYRDKGRLDNSFYSFGAFVCVLCTIDKKKRRNWFGTRFWHFFSLSSNLCEEAKYVFFCWPFFFTQLFIYFSSLVFLCK